ncbi:aminomethyltransferase, mitochondrial [Adelges cooleyi]|uniref:aminomethyltransferase, mitochondrial n=1 Tax=Adelges cooleyi TaxID=133065 RepID=UPI00217F5745|nr:aminomethyltransferase, mitochondrial [Adelges cooleyi]
MSLKKLTSILNKQLPLKKSFASNIKKTGLYEFHINNGGKMVPFAAYYMPLAYTDSITVSHLHTRQSCSLFDVSHMLQSKIYGKHKEQFMEQICVTDIQGMKKRTSALSLFVDDKTGGILDDLIVTKTEDDYLYMVTNAGCKEQDVKMITEQLEDFKSKGNDVTIEFLDSDIQSLLALQGPKSMTVLQPVVSADLSKLYFMNTTTSTVCGVPNCRINRCGYTGEDGFEISVPTDQVTTIAETLLGNESVKLAGLGARDTLRLEAGMCLHGSDIDITTTPVEAALVWTISRKRRDEKQFPGASVIMKQISEGVERKRVGLIQESQGAPVRAGAVILDADSQKVGTVTSGCPSPSLLKNIAMGYVNSNLAKMKTEVKAVVRGQQIPMVVTKMPFVKSNYYSQPK